MTDITFTYLPGGQPGEGAPIDTDSSNIDSAQSMADRPLVVGLYGLPGSGKSFLLSKLKSYLPKGDFELFEGSTVIDSTYSGGLAQFQESPPAVKNNVRCDAISHIGTTCMQNGRTGVVAGHLTFWQGACQDPELVWTETDATTYTHIVYHQVQPEVIAQRRTDDKDQQQRDRPFLSIDDLYRWQLYETTTLRELCLRHQILLSVISSPIHSSVLATSKVLALVRDIRHHTEEVNMAQAMKRIDEAVAVPAVQSRIGAMIVLDADKTLTDVDTGTMFWDAFARSRDLRGEGRACPLKALFGSPMGYSYKAFRQASLMYEEAMDYQEFDAICREVASAVVMRAEFVSLLRYVARRAHVSAVVVTCGLHLIWDMILEREGFADEVKVIGAGPISDPRGLVITAEVKAAIVRRLQEKHGVRVTAIGDSILDLPMLETAEEAIIAVGEEHARSRSLRSALLSNEHMSFRARQSLFPDDVPPFLSVDRFPVVKLDEQAFISSVIRHQGSLGKLDLRVATDKNTAKILMTPTRDARVAGPALREAHCRIGWYLAMEFVTHVIGIKEHQIPHVQGYNTNGYQLFAEESTVIVPLMRGGEPMAFGVSDAFPRAGFVHAKHPEDLKVEHLQGQSNIILVDSVINSGKSVTLFARHVRGSAPKARIVVVTGVIQKGALTEGEFSMEELASSGDVALVALRVSDNKFTGRGGTDTGHRLFNTTRLT